MGRLHLEVFDSVLNGASRRITRLTDDRGANAIEVFHEFDRLLPWSDDTPLDGHVLPVLLYAASTASQLVVHGPLSRAAMRNMHELLLAWSRWKSNRYGKLDILPERIIDGGGLLRREAAISAFSGGVDATFTALRHAQSAPDSIRYPLRSLLLVHGFDVDVYNTDDFKDLVTRLRPFVEAHNLELRTVRTNSRDLRLQDWDDSSALELAGCLHMHAGEFQYGLIGSTKSYEALVLPWGSNPVTDHLMSGGQFSVVHDGAGFSRTDKVAEILRHPLACRTLKVCYAGANQAENCGQCEKCVRTRLNFLAAGAISTPPCFPTELSLDQIRKIKIDHQAQLVELSSIVAAATVNRMGGAWLTLLQERIAAWQPTVEPVMDRQKNGGVLKRFLARSITAAGADVPAKKIWRHTRRSVQKKIDRLTGNRGTLLKEEVGQCVSSALTMARESMNSSVPAQPLGLDQAPPA